MAIAVNELGIPRGIVEVLMSGRQVALLGFG